MYATLVSFTLAFFQRYSAKLKDHETRDIENTEKKAYYSGPLKKGKHIHWGRKEKNKLQDLTFHSPTLEHDEWEVQICFQNPKELLYCTQAAHHPFFATTSDER